jgi:hypothetical protein
LTSIAVSSLAPLEHLTAFIHSNVYVFEARVSLQKRVEEAIFIPAFDQQRGQTEVIDGRVSAEGGAF